MKHTRVVTILEYDNFEKLIRETVDTFEYDETSVVEPPHTVSPVYPYYPPYTWYPIPIITCSTTGTDTSALKITPSTSTTT